jgi:hypothetical protein
VSGAVQTPFLALRAESLVFTAPDLAVTSARTNASWPSERHTRALLTLTHGEGDEPPFCLGLKHGRRRKAEPGVYRITFVTPDTAKREGWTYVDFEPLFKITKFGCLSARAMAHDLENYLYQIVGLDCSLERGPKGREYRVSFLYEPATRARVEGLPEGGGILVSGTVLPTEEACS